MARSLVLAVAATLALSAHAVAAGLEPCPDGFGFTYDARGACVRVDVDDPFNFVPDPILPETRSCGPGADRVGTNVTWGNGSYLAFCGRAGYRLPDGSSTRVRWSLTECGPGVDPVVEAGGGRVYFCVNPAAIVGNETVPVEVDLTPCPGGFDPTVRVGGTTIEICVVLVS